MSTTVFLKGVRLSYAQALWHSKPFDDTPGATKAWSSDLLIDKEKQDDQYQKVVAVEFAEFEAVLPDKQKPLARKLFDALGYKDRRILDGDIHGQEGYWIVKARATDGKQPKPIVLDRRATRVEQGAEGAPYSGAFVNAQVEFWAQFGTYKRTNCTLQVVQMVKDGDAFGGGKPADLSKFQDLGDQGEDDEAESELA